MKKLISLILALTMILTFIPASFAAERDFTVSENIATRLKALGLFRGVSETDFALAKAPTRVEALVMLVRLLGKEEAAMNTSASHPFTDVPSWAEKYVAYAYSEKLTNGISETKFGSGNAASAEMYITFVLRALGYKEGAGLDFVWNNPKNLAEKAGLLRGNPDCKNFLRADVVIISYAALDAKLKESDITLGKSLIDAGVFSSEAFNANFNATLISGGLKPEEELVVGGDDAYEKLLSFLAEKKSGLGSLANDFAGYFVSVPDIETMNIYSLSYLPDTEEFQALCTLNITNREFLEGISVIFKKDSPDVIIEYTAKDPTKLETLASATQTVKKTDITLQLKTDSCTQDINESLAPANIKEVISENMPIGALFALAFVNNIMHNDVSKGDMDIRNLGFVNLVFAE